MKIYVIYYNKKKCGPFSYEDLQKFLNLGKIDLTIFAWKKGMKSWVHLGDMEEFSTRKKVIPPTVENENSNDLTHQNKIWFLYSKDNKTGPLTTNEIETLLIEKKIRRTSPAYKAGMTKWKKLIDIPDFDDFFKTKIPAENVSEQTLREKNFNAELTMVICKEKLRRGIRRKLFYMLPSACLIIILSSFLIVKLYFKTNATSNPEIESYYKIGIEKRDQAKKLIKESKEFFKQGCNKNHINSCISYGIYERDWGNIKIAEKMFNKACTLGSFNSCTEYVKKMIIKK